MLKLNGSRWQLIRWNEASQPRRSGLDSQVPCSAQWLQLLKADDTNMTTLRRRLCHELDCGQMTRMTDDEVIGCLAALLNRRVYYFEEVLEESFGSASLGQPASSAALGTQRAPTAPSKPLRPAIKPSSPAPAPPSAVRSIKLEAPSRPRTVNDAPPSDPVVRQVPTFWIEIELVCEDETPVSSEPYHVVLPDGSIVDGVLSSEGRARIDAIPTAGNCQVSFPQLGKGARNLLSIPTRPKPAATRAYHG